MRKLNFIIGVFAILLWGLPMTCKAENPMPTMVDEKSEVLKVINQVFDGMRKGDSAMISATFYKEARLSTIYMKEDQPVLHEGSLSQFLVSVGTPHEKVYDERIWDPVVQIDGHMASVWVNYAFYHGTDFSHCGVNAFQLFKDETGWKIVNLIDTRRKEDCNQP